MLMENFRALQLELVLASQSPRRQELLSHLKIPFRIQIAGIEENCEHQDPNLYVCSLAEMKAQAVKAKLSCQNNKQVVILAADTVVYCDGRILEKPRDAESAKQMLKLLSNREHTVLTGVYLVCEEYSELFSVKTQVIFDSIDPQTLETYIESKEFLDKAGSYGIQGQAQVFVREINGSYSNVVGLPLSRVRLAFEKLIQKMGGDPSQWRRYFSVS